MKRALQPEDGRQIEIVLENIAKVEPVPVKLWGMSVRASARILEKSVQDNLIEEVERAQRDRKIMERSLPGMGASSSLLTSTSAVQHQPRRATSRHRGGRRGENQLEF